MKLKIVLSGICLLALLLFVGVEQFTASFQFSAILVLCGFLLLLVSCKAKLAERKNLETSYSLVCFLMAGIFASLAPFDGQIRLSTTKELLCVLTGISVSILTGYQLFLHLPIKRISHSNRKDSTNDPGRAKKQETTKKDQQGLAIMPPPNY